MSEVSRILGLPWPTLRKRRGLALVAALVLLSACGQKGPLYLAPAAGAPPGAAAVVPAVPAGALQR